MKLSINENNQDFPEDFIGKLVIINPIQGKCEVDYSNITTSINHNPSSDFIKIYPIPVRDRLNIESIEEMTNAIILSSKGESIKSQIVNSRSVVIGLNDMSKGTYFLITEYKDGRWLISKFFVL